MSLKLTLADLESDLASSLPANVVKRLLAAYSEIKQHFYLGRHEPSELNAGKLCEITVRILELEAGRTQTPFGKGIPNMSDFLRGFEKETQADDSIRFHIPRLLNALYNIRNKRGVGHVGGDVNPNLADATLLAAGADWVIAELVRRHYRCSIDEAQAVVDGLVQRRIPLVYEIDGSYRVLNPTLGYQEKTLILLAARPNGAKEAELFAWVEHSNSSVYRRDVLRVMHRKKLIEYSNAKCTILPPGIKLVDDHHIHWSDYSPTVGKVKMRRR